MYNSVPAINAAGSTNLTLLELPRSHKEKGKKRREERIKIYAALTRQNGGK